MVIRTLTIDLDIAPEESWSCLAPMAASCRSMLNTYVADLGGLEAFGPLLEEYAAANVPRPHLAEMKAIAEIVRAPISKVLLANLYYDAMSVMLGCTAFAVDTSEGPLHARNLDWWSPSNALSSETIVYRFVRNGETRFMTVSWPGFNGALSGVALGRFAVTLNAVLSDESPPDVTTDQVVPPITSLIRDVLDKSPSYADAVQTLTETPLVSSSLLLVSGTRNGEMCVIERTPSKGVIREASSGFIVVTNDYRLINPDKPVLTTNELQQTSCHRFDRATELITTRQPHTERDAMKVLRDEQVRMTITAQHMTFRARSGHVLVALPDGGELSLNHNHESS